MFAVASAGAAQVEALFGETPPIQLVVRLPDGRDLREDERAAISREVELVRRRYLAMGLLVRVEDAVERLGRERPGTSVVFEPKEGGALRALGEFLGDDAAELKRRFPFPAANPATLAPRDRPTARAYLATEDDFRLMDRALAGVWKAAPGLFPEAPGAVDVIVQDTSDFHIYSLRGDYPYPKTGRRGRYHVYRVAHDERPPEHEMWGCAAGPPKLFPVLERRVITERAIRCAPWGSFRARQEKSKTIYRFEEGYLATLIHEFGHVYEDMRSTSPTDDMLEIRRRVRAVELPPAVDRKRAMAEAFAQWCELLGARELYPAQFRRLMKEARREREDTDYGHAAGLRAAAEMADARFGGK